MEQRTGRVSNILDGDEEIEDHVDLGRNEVVVTSRRVLALQSAADGERYRAVERSSVTDVTTETEGTRDLLKKAGILAGFGAVPLALDVVLDFDELLSLSRSDVPGSAAQLVDWILLTFTAIDLSLTILWALSAIVALAYLAKYFLGRTAVLRMAVVGAADVVVPADEEPPVERIDAAIARDTSADTPDSELTADPVDDQSDSGLAAESSGDQPAAAADSAWTDDAPADPFFQEQSAETVDDLFDSAAEASDDRGSLGMTDEDVDDLFGSESSDEDVEDLFAAEQSDEASEDPFEQS